MEAAALVPVAFVGEAQLLEVLGSLRRDVGFEFHRDPTQLRGVAVAAELDVEVAHGVRGVHLEGGHVAHWLVDDLEDILGSGLAGTHGLRLPGRGDGSPRRTAFTISSWLTRCLSRGSRCFFFSSVSAPLNPMMPAMRKVAAGSRSTTSI